MQASWWNEIDKGIWEKSGMPWARELGPFSDDETDDLIQCASLYHLGPLKGLRGVQKDRAAWQQKGWFSLWHWAGHEWVDLLTGVKVPAPGPPLPQVALARALPSETVWDLHFPHQERLSAAEAQPLLQRLRFYENPGAVEILQVWFRRRELCLDARESFEVTLTPRCKGVETFLERLEDPARREGKSLTFDVKTGQEEHLDDHPLVQWAERLGDVESYWRGVAAPALAPPSPTEELLIRWADYTLRFPVSLGFQSLHKAISCLYGSPQTADSYTFRLSLDRVATPDDDYGWDRSCLRLSETERVAKHVHPGSFLHWNEVQLHVLDVTPEAGPSPWFVDGPSEANRRLRSAFHSRLGKLVLEPQPVLPGLGAEPLPGLSQRNLSELKVKEAMVTCLIEAARPLTLPEVANFLRLEGYPLPFGVESLKKAWRRDSILREDSLGRVHVVSGAVLLDSWLMSRLDPIFGGEESLTRILEGLFRLNALPDTAEVDEGHPQYVYGCLHGYVLVKGKRQPVDWRKKSQPDLWEKLYRARSKPQVVLTVRDQEPRILQDTWMTRDHTVPFVLMVRSQFDWEDICLDDILDVIC